MPVTNPPDVIVAMEGLLLLQVPPVVALPSVVVVPAHSVVVPVMAATDGAPLTVRLPVPVAVQPAALVMV